MPSPLFDHSDYRAYLSDRLPTRGEGRGARTRVAATLGCQSAHISQVLKGISHLSLEHAALVDRFLSHDREESEYFMLLVHRDRAGAVALREFYDRRCKEILSRREEVAGRVNAPNRLPKDFAEDYYRSWHHSAVHMLTLIPSYQTRDSLARRLRLPPESISESLSLLLRAGLITERNGRLKASSQRVHLGKDAPALSKHHTNWRVQALHSLDRSSVEDLHYSGPLAVTRESARKLRGLLLETLSKTEKLLSEPGEEEVFCLNMDFFLV